MANDWQRDQETWAAFDDRLPRCLKGQNHANSLASTTSLDHADKTERISPLLLIPPVQTQLPQPPSSRSPPPPLNRCINLSSCLLLVKITRGSRHQEERKAAVKPRVHQGQACGSGGAGLVKVKISICAGKHAQIHN